MKFNTYKTHIYTFNDIDNIEHKMYLIFDKNNLIMFYNHNFYLYYENI